MSIELIVVIVVVLLAGTDPGTGPGGLARKRFLLDLDAHVSGRASRLL
ncbi:MAG: hypothetical protein ABSB59_43770 [Streptosporangiaceae bacterium]|jgi:hypothetical protein